ncbi:ABC transporter ATP-binding protein [uncultured Vagococcus sp.]|uniref:ABC transporter ATP-binding protein n=1 Tax=uncultured Vagococcus sp. TaxID=189676 RepID=UPI0028D32DBD|nr:ABC transporter ATP-binding protein [uncultured Vagococcus sp.]
MMVLEVSGIKKKFGSQEVLKGLDFSLPEQSVLGFIGQNGAGKTTLMKMIVGLLSSDEGTIKVCDEVVYYGNTKTNRLIGYLPDVPEFYGYMTALGYLTLCGEITGMTGPEIKLKATDLLNLVGLENNKKKIQSFSRGMKQRLGIAQALLNEPKLLICDEPTSALDPLGRKEILDILHRVKAQTTVIFSTHILSDVEKICDQIILLHEGEIKLSTTLAEMQDRYSFNQLLIEFNEALLPEDVTYLFKDLVVKVESGVYFIQGQELTSLQETLYPRFIQRGLFPKKMEVYQPSLEDIFSEVVK